MKPRKWTEADLRVATQNARSIRQILHTLGLREAGGNYTQIQKYLTYYNIPREHLSGKGWNKGSIGIKSPRRSLSSILVAQSDFQSHKLKKRLFSAKLKEPRCEQCGWAQISPDGRLPLELDHKNGNRRDNRLENLRILCPNCHSLQPTHRGKNRNKYATGLW